MSADAWRVEPMGDLALLLHAGEGLDDATSARVHAASAALAAARLPGLVDLVPAYASLLLRFDPFVWGDAAAAQTPSARCAEAALSVLDHAQRGGAAARLPARTLEIPVCYGGEFGPDLAELAAHAGLEVRAAVALHSGADYRVAMLGFAPGFPYLLGLPAALHAPRRATPRTRVPAGSVAIGGAQTGIYPRELPGGWQLIGRTPLRLFDPMRAEPALLAPGDRVRLRPIDAAAFDALASAADSGA